jgi:hypothetical protein
MQKIKFTKSDDIGLYEKGDLGELSGYNPTGTQFDKILMYKNNTYVAAPCSHYEVID